ncbi:MULTISPECIES: hypothetical protein [Acinetobacter Taxon 24D]|uniref:hypothetical protein n=1 Tax=Acinetobacter Taxon 24D TaxID=2839057 RepID=UPI00103C45BB|nr:MULTISPECIES: hypothetical protein [Acinetobacter Taxon 24D]NNG81811.1 hypothetical protein [Acinetobacter sp. ANC 5378]TCH63752.1 hypothetical protein E0409_08260 [Acinetobacter sp. ANC 4862]
MNKNFLLSSILCGLCLAPFAASANDKVEKVYDAQRYQKVCKGKSQGAPVSFAYRGIIWNGTCEPQFFPSGKNASVSGDEAELMNACSGDMNAKMATVNGTEMKGKCALGFMAPRPTSQPPMQSEPQMQSPMQSEPQMQPQMQSPPPMQHQMQTQPQM